MDNIETKNCPFCGSNDIDLAFSRGFDGGDESRPIISAGCMNCGTCGPDVPVPKTGKIETGYEESAAAWNNRAAPVPAMPMQDDCDHLDPWQIAEGTKCNCTTKAMPIPKQEPIYMWRLEDDGWMECTKEWFYAAISEGYEKRIFYAEPQPAQAAAIPEGWRLVPERPTQEMQRAGNSIKIFAGFNGMDEHVYVRTNYTEVKEIYEAMLSAAPKPE